MSKSHIKVSELFYSIQGEGKYSGAPSVFLRTFGCNFRCKGFGLPRGVETTEVQQVIQRIHEYNSYNDLPLVSTGCDSYAAIYPEFKKFSAIKSIDLIVTDIMELLPKQQWTNEHLVITGGEPLLGWQRCYPDLLSHAHMKPLRFLTFETNGTQKLQQDFYDYLKQFVSQGKDLTFSVSPKLSASGEPNTAAIKPEIIVEYQEVGNVYLKFVVDTLSSAEEVINVVQQYQNAGFNGPVYLMPAGGTTESFQENDKYVAKLALDNGFYYSDRLHVRIFANQWGT